MHLNGWRSRQMVDRYASDVADQRALEGRHDLTGGSGLILSE